MSWRVLPKSAQICPSCWVQLQERRDSKPCCFSVKLDLLDLAVAWINGWTMADTKTGRKEVQSYEITIWNPAASVPNRYIIDHYGSLWIIMVHLTFGVSGNDWPHPDHQPPPSRCSDLFRSLPKLIPWAPWASTCIKTTCYWAESHQNKGCVTCPASFGSKKSCCLVCLSVSKLIR